MTPEAVSRLAKSMRFMEQARRQSPQESPEATIHLAYYAMLHAAAAVLLERTGDVPKTHSGVIGQFSRMVAQDDRGRSFSRSFNSAEQLRLISDYEDAAIPTAEDAAQLCTEASEFVTYCRSLL